MKRLAFLLCGSIVLVSCSRQGTLEPPEVLKRAGEQAQALSAAHIDASYTYHGTSSYMTGVFDVAGNINGTLQNGGQQLSATVDATIKRVDDNQQLNTMILRGTITETAPNETYVNIDTLSIDPPTPLLDDRFIAAIQHQWLRLPQSHSATGAMMSGVTPDPSFLRMQTQVITVTKDHGFANVGGHTDYVYDVTLDRQKLMEFLTQMRHSNGSNVPVQNPLDSMAASGRVWIDADTFDIHRIVWDLHSLTAAEPLSAHLDVTVTAHNDPSINIAPPADSKPFPLVGVGASSNDAASSTSSSPNVR